MAHVYNNLNLTSRGREMEVYIKVILGVMRPESILEIPEKRGHRLPSQPKINRIRHESTENQYLY
jgi:hypothetical protein